MRKNSFLYCIFLFYYENTLVVIQVLSFYGSDALKHFISRKYTLSLRRRSTNGKMIQKTANNSSFVLSLITETDNEALLFLYVSAASLNVLGWS